MPPRKQRRISKEPKLHKLADKLTEILIYFMVIFSPWAFGTTQTWSIRTMNITAYALGFLLITKWITRLSPGFKPWTKNTPKNELSPRQNRLRLIHKYCNLLTAVCMILLLGYMLTSAINARAAFNLETREYTYFTEFNKNLPHSYDAKATWFLFWQYLGLIILFWATKDWLAGAKPTRKPSSINPRLKKLLFVICINGGILALECILQRLHYGEFKGKLLFLVEPGINKTNISQFGPYAYRSNAASYFNLIWPIGLGLLLQMAKNNLELGKKRIGNSPELILIPCIILIASGPIISSARGGAFVMVGLLILTTLSIPLLRIKSKFVFVAFIGCILLAMLAGYHFGWEKLEPRLMNIFTDNLSSRKQIYEATHRMIDQYVSSNTPPSPFGSGPGSFEAVAQFELNDTLTRWETWAHNDYLEILLTFGLPGGIAFISIIALQLVILIFNTVFYNQTRLYYCAGISLLGVSIHAIGDFPFQVYSIQLLTLLFLASTTVKLNPSKT